MSPEPFFLAQICTKWFSGWGFAQDPTEGAHSAPTDPLARKGGGEREGGEGTGRDGRSGYAHAAQEQCQFWNPTFVSSRNGLWGVPFEFNDFIIPRP